MEILIHQQCSLGCLCPPNLSRIIQLVEHYQLKSKGPIFIHILGALLLNWKIEIRAIYLQFYQNKSIFNLLSLLTVNRKKMPLPFCSFCDYLLIVINTIMSHTVFDKYKLQYLYYMYFETLLCS